MDIKINMANTKISDKAKVLSNMTVSSISDINVGMDRVEIKDEAEFLNNLTDVQIDELLSKLKDQAQLLEKTGEEYEEIRNLLADVQQSRFPAREILKQYLPNLLTGTLANIFGNIIMK